jgi:hypothetical protein
MKKFVIFSLAVLMLATFTHSVFAEAASFSFSGYTWLRETGVSDTYKDTSLNSSKMSVERTYLTVNMNYEDNIAGRLTLDMPMKAGTNAKNNDWTTFVKYAYVDVKNQLPLDTTIRLGQQPVYFAMIDKWDYSIIYKNLEDNLGLLSSADLGVGLLGYLPGGWGDFQVAAYNGNGYAMPTETDNNAATDVSLNVIPLPGLSIRGSIYNSVVSTIDASKASDGAQTGKWYNGVAVNYNWGPMWLMWEGVEGMKPNTLDTDSSKVSGNSKMVLWNLNEQWQVAVREDVYDPDVNNDYNSVYGRAANVQDALNSKQDKMMYGINYQWFKDLKVQLDWSTLKYDIGNQALTPTATVKTPGYTDTQTVMQLVWSF